MHPRMTETTHSAWVSKYIHAIDRCQQQQPQHSSNIACCCTVVYGLRMMRLEEHSVTDSKALGEFLRRLLRERACFAYCTCVSPTNEMTYNTCAVLSALALRNDNDRRSGCCMNTQKEHQIGNAENVKRERETPHKCAILTFITDCVCHYQGGRAYDNGGTAVAPTPPPLPPPA